MRQNDAKEPSCNDTNIDNQELIVSNRGNMHASNHEKVSVESGLYEVPDLIQDISWVKGQHKKTPPKTPPATAR